MPPSLSEKAKGKQRATEPEQAEFEAPPSRDLTIRFTEGIPDLTVQVAEKDTVKDVKTNVSLSTSPPSHFVLTVLLYSAADPCSPPTTQRQAVEAYTPGAASRRHRATVLPDSVRPGASAKVCGGELITPGGWNSRWRRRGHGQGGRGRGRGEGECCRHDVAALFCGPTIERRGGGRW